MFRLVAEVNQDEHRPAPLGACRPRIRGLQLAALYVAGYATKTYVLHPRGCQASSGRPEVSLETQGSQ